MACLTGHQQERDQPMPLTDHAPATLRMLFTACAADPKSGLNATQRAAIWTSLTDWQWAPDPAAPPETAATVEAWYAGLTHGPPIEIIIRAEESTS